MQVALENASCFDFLAQIIHLEVLSIKVGDFIMV